METCMKHIFELTFDDIQFICSPRSWPVACVFASLLVRCLCIRLALGPLFVQSPRCLHIRCLCIRMCSRCVCTLNRIYIFMYVYEFICIHMYVHVFAFKKKKGMYLHVLIYIFRYSDAFICIYMDLYALICTYM